MDEGGGGGFQSVNVHLLQASLNWSSFPLCSLTPPTSNPLQAQVRSVSDNHPHSRLQR